jgi:eukaryotic-like serine/threonine-protein kinase
MIGENLCLERELGQGGMGAVWLAQHRTLGSQVAVKVLLRADSELAKTRFVKEARAVAQIDSPHVVKIFDYGVTGEGDPYIVMELLRGEDLKARIQRTGGLGLKDTVAIVTQACKGLARAHASGIVHRDIKPANLFLMEADGDIFVKVLDFGVARYTVGDDLNLTSTGTMIGTPYYMAPEQIVNPRDSDHRVDLWAMGVVTYVCLTGDLPFQGETLGALTVAIHSGVFPPITARRPDLPKALDAWFAKALSVDREGRFSGAKELAEALAQVAQGAQPTTGPQAMPAAAPIHAFAVTASQPPPYSAVPQVSAPSPYVAAATPYPHYAGPQPPSTAQQSAHPMAQPHYATMHAQQPYPILAQAAPRPPSSNKGVILGVAAVIALGGLGAGLFFSGVLDGASDGLARDEDMSRAPSSRASGAPSAETQGSRAGAAATESRAGAPPGKASPRSAAPATTTPAQGGSQAPVPTTPSAAASAAGTPSKSSGAIRGAGLTCWSGNEGATVGQSASSALISVVVGPPRSIKVSGPASAFKGFTSCVVSKVSSMPIDPGDTGTVDVSVSLPANAGK